MRKYCFVILSTFTCLNLSSQVKPSAPPSNTPAEIILKGKELIVKYDNIIILSGQIGKDPSSFYLRQVTDKNNGAVTQVFSITSSDYKNFEFNGIITGSPESFPCEADRKQTGTVIVRHTVGLSSSLLNRAVYDRRSDWALSVDMSYSSADLKISPQSKDQTSNKFGITIIGNEIVFRFRATLLSASPGVKVF